MFSKTLLTALALVGAVSAIPNPNWSSSSSSTTTPCSTTTTTVTPTWPTTTTTSTKPTTTTSTWTTTSTPTSTKPTSTSTTITSTSTSTPGGGGSTTPGPQCCQNVTNSNDLSASEIGLLSLLGVVLGGLNVPIGTGCTPIDILGGVQCNTNTVQCGQVYSSALIGINCVPVIINA